MRTAGLRPASSAVHSGAGTVRLIAGSCAAKCERTSVRPRSRLGVYCMKTHTVPVTRRCNQRCGFCDQVDPNGVDPSLGDIRATLVSCAVQGAREVVITGG